MLSSWARRNAQILAFVVLALGGFFALRASNDNAVDAAVQAVRTDRENADQIVYEALVVDCERDNLSARRPLHRYAAAVAEVGASDPLITDAAEEAAATTRRIDCVRAIQRRPDGVEKMERGEALELALLSLSRGQGER